MSVAEAKPVDRAETESGEPGPRLGPDSAGLRMTPEEFDATPAEDWDENYRYELIDGVLIVTPAPSEKERGPNGYLEYLLWAHHETHPRGHVLDDTLAEQELKIGARRRRTDRAIWAGLGRVPDLKADFPTILVEFVSPGRRAWRRDYEEKRRDYLGAGAQEYWVIDRFARTLTAYRAAPAEPAEVVVPADGTYSTDWLPGFVLPLARLLERADRWGSAKR